MQSQVVIGVRRRWRVIITVFEEDVALDENRKKCLRRKTTTTKEKKQKKGTTEANVQQTTGRSKD